MKNKWFENVFLTSLMERAGINNPIWLTVKQTSICCQYMKSETVVIENRFLTQRHTNYTYTWNDRKVFLSYSQKNGCGTITFYPNESEKRQLFEKYCEEKRKQILDDADRRIKRAIKFVNGESGLFEKRTPEEYINRLKRYKHNAVEDFRRYVYAYRHSEGEGKAQIELKLFELYHKFKSLKKCIEIVKTISCIEE